MDNQQSLEQIDEKDDLGTFENSENKHQNKPGSFISSIHNRLDNKYSFDTQLHSKNQIHLSKVEEYVDHHQNYLHAGSNNNNSGEHLQEENKKLQPHGMWMVSHTAAFGVIDIDGVLKITKPSFPILTLAKAYNVVFMFACQF